MGLYRSTTDESGRLLSSSPYYADSIFALLDEKKGKKEHESASQHEFTFNVAQLPPHIVSMQSEFHVYRAVSREDGRTASKPPQPPSPYLKTISPHPFIFLKLFYVKIDPEGRQVLQLLEMKRVFRHYHGWIVFNTNEALAYWLKLNQNNTNKDLILKADYGDRTPFRDIQELNFVQRHFPNTGRLQPCLIVYCWDGFASPHRRPNFNESEDLTQDTLYNDPWRYTRVYMHNYPRPKSRKYQPVLRRSKRNTVQFTKMHSAVAMKNRPLRPYCRRRKMVVSFAQLNMTDWILAPITFDAGLCSGTCAFPLGQETHPTNHAVLQSVWSRFLRTSVATSGDAFTPTVSSPQVPPPCCVPHELEALPMLYFQTDNRVVLNHRPDMVVRSCGCE